MPEIYDNIDRFVRDGLQEMLQNARRADFCVGYFNLRGWGVLADSVEQLSGEDGDFCRLLIGMQPDPYAMIRRGYSRKSSEITQQESKREVNEAKSHFKKQLTWGIPTNQDAETLKRLAEQLRAGKVRAKYHSRYPLHAKLYLAHREDSVAALTGMVGSSNLTFSGLQKNGELNVDVMDQDATRKLSDWFEKRWNDERSQDITEFLAETIENSWAIREVSPYWIYLKTAYELSKEAIHGISEYPIPREFRGQLLDFQEQAVAVAARILKNQGGVFIGDVVGLGKTIVASAVAKIFQNEESGSILVICPPNLEEMWKKYMLDYVIAGETLSTGQLKKLKDMRRYKMIIVDESHNFRNRKSKGHAHLRDYIRDNDSSVVLLSATPYNKAFTDIASQLRLFLPADQDLGIRPESLVKQMEGVDMFRRKHSQTLISSLAAFERSDHADDWRDMMRRYMVRRTRGHIKSNYAEYSTEKKQHYLEFASGDRFYFPDRKPINLNFAFKEKDRDDDYAKLYSEASESIINELKLARYGLGNYKHDNIEFASKEDKEVIENLTRAGVRLRGFARSTLFKRLESSGESFLKSIRRNMLRNALYIAALEADGGELPIGQVYAAETDDALDDADLGEQRLFGEELGGIEDWRQHGVNLYNELRNSPERKRKFDWVSKRYFNPALLSELESDNKALLKLHDLVPEWDPKRDRKLNALIDLVLNKHGNDKVLIFTQYADTAEYLYKGLKNAGAQSIDVVHGTRDHDVLGLAKRFSPRSNDADHGKLDELRVLVATDVLSEGQNLQDAHIIVNYDLPWAIIRLVQRVGRVDRIGQKSPEILCYSAMPEDGIEEVIDLRGRLRRRMHQNKELIGSDERFFEGDEEQQAKDLRALYDGTASLEETDDETDLLSYAYDIWRQAIESDPELEETIKNLPNVVYSAKKADHGGAIAYIKDSGGQDILAQVSVHGDVVSLSQSSILDLLKCDPDEDREEPAENHHELVGNAVDYLENAAQDLGGQLGGTRSVRHRVYSSLKLLRQQDEAEQPLVAANDLLLPQIIQAIYDRPLTEVARARFREMLKDGTGADRLLTAALSFWDSKNLCIRPKDQQEPTTEIICSMGLVK